MARDRKGARKEAREGKELAGRTEAARTHETDGPGLALALETDTAEPVFYYFVLYFCCFVV